MLQQRAELKFWYNLFVMFLIENTTEPFKVIMVLKLSSILVKVIGHSVYAIYYNETSRGAGAQAYDCDRDRLWDRSHGNKIFNIIVSSLW